MEITQFTYFQQAGGIDLAPISAEITYGLERLTMFLARESSVYDIDWTPGVPYGAVRKQDEYEFSKYYFEVAGVDLHWKLLDMYEGEARRCLDAKLVLPAYDWTLKCSHVFNTLDARGAVSVTERVGVIKRVRDLAVRCAEGYLEARKELGFPLLKTTLETTTDA
jgi:glycyl-tRNA synthetase alpha chain